MKKNVMRLEGQTQLTFASQRQEQEGQEPATAIEKDDATTTAQAKSKERKFFGLWLKKYSIRGWVRRKIAITCTAEFARRLGNLKEWARKPSTEIFKTPLALTRHVGLLKHRVALQGPEIRKSFEEARRKGEVQSRTGAFQVRTVGVSVGTSSWFGAWRHS